MVVGVRTFSILGVEPVASIVATKSGEESQWSLVGNIAGHSAGQPTRSRLTPARWCVDGHFRRACSASRLRLSLQRQSLRSASPFGWVADVVGFCLGAYALGSSVWQVAGDLQAFGHEFQSALSEQDLKSAGSHLARALSVIGVGTFMLWLTKRAARAVLTTQELRAAAKSVMLNSADREIAFWSGVDPMRIPSRYATLEGMLSETPAGRALLKALQSRNNFKKDEAVWYELSNRMADLGSDNSKPVHYFVAKSRGYREALQVGEVPRAWWQEYRPKLEQRIRTSMLRDGKSPAEIEQRVARLSKWSQEEIEAQYYAEHRVIQRGAQKFYEDEVFHKIEKLGLKGAWVHELDEKGVEVGARFWADFSLD